jgi:hypothetical protein
MFFQKLRKNQNEVESGEMKTMHADKQKNGDAVIIIGDQVDSIHRQNEQVRV